MLFLALFGMMLEPLSGISICRADISVSLNGPGGQASQVIPGVSGSFNVDMPLAKNSQNKITVTAADEHGNTASRDVFITQISYDNLVIAQVKAEPLPPARIEQLVQDGVIQLDNPANFNVSQFTIVMTIDKQPVEVSLPIAVPKEQPEKGGWETYRLPWGNDSGGSLPPPPEIQIVVFEEALPGEPGEPAPPPIPGVIIIEGRIKSLKEFFSVRLLLMNISGIFTLADVSAELEFTNGGLSNVLPADGMASFGDIPPGTQTEPVTAEKEFIVRGDEIGTREIKVNFGGKVAGPGIAAGEEIPFNGSASTSVEVKGAPTFLVQVTHPDAVQAGVPYELLVDITNTGETPALYASLDLDLGGDGEFLDCEIDGGGTPVCSEVPGPLTRPLGNIYPAGKVRQSFTIKPGETGGISSCLGVSDQNITLQVVAGIKGCLVGKYPPEKGTADNAPTVFVLPGANQLGVALTSAVSAFFSKLVNRDTITTGESGSFNVFDKAGTRIPGKLRFDDVNGRTVAVWQVDDGVTNRLSANMEYTVQLTQDIRDGAGYGLAAAWLSKFTTTGEWFDDLLPPVITLSVEPPVNPNAVIPGQRININAYASDQGSGVGRVELRIKDLTVDGSTLQLIDQKNVLKGDLPPYNFAVDSGGLVPGHTYQLQATAYDLMGNAQSSTLAVVLLSSAAPPTITLPAAQDVLHGLSLQLTPVQVTGGVTQVEYFLDSTVQPFDTVKLPPYSTSLTTAGLELDVHTITAIVTDGLGQTGQAVFTFTVRENLSTPTVKINSPVDGAWVVLGQKLSVSGEAADDTGIKSIKWYLDDPAGTPLVSDVTSFLLNTAGAAPGDHTLYLVATNNVDRSSNVFAAASSRTFRVVSEAPSPAPAAPGITGISEPADGTVTVTGTAPAGRRVDVTNTTLGLTLTTYADSSGMFTMTIAGAAGDEISVVVFDPTQTNASAPATGTVNEALVLTSIEVLPPVVNFTSLSGSTDLAVTAHYADGSSRTVTSQAAFASNDITVASVNSAGRVVPVKNGSTKVKALLAGKEAAADVNVNVIVPTVLTLSPGPLSFTDAAEAQTLAVRANYSDGSSAVVPNSSVVFISSNPLVTTVNGSGVVRPQANGDAQVTAQLAGFTPATVNVHVAFAHDDIPTVEILGPVDGTGVERGETVAVNVRARDAVGGVKSVTLEAAGAVTSQETKQAGGAASTTQQFLLAIPAGASIGSSITLTVTAEDVNGNVSAAAGILLNVVDRTAPAVSITKPANLTPFNYGDVVEINVTASDSVGVTQIRYLTAGGVSQSEAKSYTAAPGAQSAVFRFTVPYAGSSPDVRIRAYAGDAAGNEREAVPVDIVLTFADITPPETQATAASDPGSGTATTISYQVTSGSDDLDHVELYFRRNGIGTFNRYTDADHGNPEGKFHPVGAAGTIIFDNTKMGGAGTYEFYTVGVDSAGNREAAPLDGLGATLPDQQAVFTAGEPYISLVAPTLIGEGDAAYDNQSLRIDNAVVTIIGAHTFHNLELVNGAVLTHPETDLTQEYGLHVSAWTVTVDATSRIDVSGRGYLGGLHNGNTCVGDSAPGLAGSGPYAGGSYGGPGGAAGSNAANALYGLLTDPMEPGSGGGCGDYDRKGGDGGGKIKLNTINIAVDGRIAANGEDGGDYTAGSGSGGSIHITTASMSGTGMITASGGANDVGGGGGRIAVFYIDVSTINPSHIAAVGGDGSSRDGGNGTVFLKGVSESNGMLVVDGQGAASSFSTLPIPPGYVFDTIILRNSAKVVADDPLVVNGELRLENNSVLTHTRGSTAGLRVQAKSLVIDSTSAIDVSAKGYRGGLQYGAPCAGETLNGAFYVAAKSGGSYGGLGARTANPAYGQAGEPEYLGSGGGCGDYDRVGGMGGGRVRLDLAEKLEVNGKISADGGLSGAYDAGGGSGGSVRISTSMLKGTGSITANGSAEDTGGGGGRIAIYYDYVDASGKDLSNLRNITARGGRGDVHGSAGTVLLKRSDQSYGDLYLDEELTSGTSTRWTPLTHLGFGTIQALTSDTITLDGRVQIMPGALVGMEVNPNIEQSATFRVTSNTGDTITVVPLSGVSLTAAAEAGDTYAGVNRFDNVYFRRGAWLVLGDMLRVEKQLKIAERGVLTHYDATMAFDSRLDIAAGKVEVAADSRIDVDERGLLGGLNEGNGCSGRTYPPFTGSGPKSGGSYGGLGSGSTPNQTYGSVVSPAHLGSGGGCGDYDRKGGDGGGWIKVHADEMLVDGVVSANGGIPGNYGAAGGAGGSLNVEVGTLSGSGVIRANGGADDNSGGGGRIAVSYQNLLFDGSHFEVLGGQGSSAKGGNGTLFLKSSAQTNGDLIIDGHALSAANDKSPIPAAYTFDNVVLRNSALVLGDSPLNIAGELRLENNSKLMHTRGLDNGLQINAASVRVDATSAIDVSGRGYRGGLRDGAPCSGETLGGLFNVREYTGGSYGGYGGKGNGSPQSLVYGSPSEPVYLGSGGGCGDYDRKGGDGGGRVEIAARGTVEVLGAIKADGSASESYDAGAGSGGSIKIEAQAIKGSGSISANGGGGDVAGGGGRIAVFYGNLGGAGEDFNGLRKVTAYGGRADVYGSAGTVLFKQAAQLYGDLYLDEGLTANLYRHWTPLTHIGFGQIKELTADTITTFGTVQFAPGGLVGLKINPDINQDTEFTIIGNTADTISVLPTGGRTLTDVAAPGDTYAGIYRFDNTVVRGGAFLVLGDRLVVGNKMLISEQSQVTHFDATLSFSSHLDLNAGTLEITGGSAIDVSGRGYLGGYQQGNGCSGQTIPGLAGSTYRAAGSYGGLGVTSGHTPNAVYGSASDPRELGSGGGCGDYDRKGGDGGGWIQLAAGEMLVDGSILANGGTGGPYGAGAGSGGAVNIYTGSLRGTGAIRADGGGSPTSYGGGGGRVAISYDTFDFGLSGVLSSVGGQGESGGRGGTGSVYLEER